jgi:hypothetical protein
MTEFPTGLILANCIFKGFFRRVALPRPSGEPLATHISYARSRSDQIRMAEFPSENTCLIWNSRNNSGDATERSLIESNFLDGKKSSRGCPCVPSQNTESMLANAAS